MQEFERIFHSFEFYQTWSACIFNTDPVCKTLLLCVGPRGTHKYSLVQRAIQTWFFGYFSNPSPERETQDETLYNKLQAYSTTCTTTILDKPNQTTTLENVVEFILYRFIEMLKEWYGPHFAMQYTLALDTSYVAPVNYHHHLQHHQHHQQHHNEQQQQLILLRPEGVQSPRYYHQVPH